MSTPGNARYGKYLTPAAWIAEYSPSEADFDAVKKYLVDSGETIYATPVSRQYIVFRGPAAATLPAFGTALHNYRVQGKVVSAPSGAPTSGTRAAPRPAIATRTADAAAAPNCGSYWAQYTKTVPVAYH